jgi:superfamily I DNA/RNA helicase
MTTFSQYQLNVFDFISNGKGNAVINAVAGSGKTFTIVNALSKIDICNKVLFLAFNKHIVTELKNRISQSNVSINTLHAQGMSIIRYNMPKAYLNADKISNYIKTVFNDWNIDESIVDGYQNRIKKLIDLAKLNLISNEDDLLDVAIKHDIEILNGEIHHALNVLNETNKDKSCFDFTDMVYWPIQFSLPAYKFDFVFIDECQDLSICQQKLMLSLIKPNGRFIAVGDPNQCIYGFAGSDTESFNKLVNMPNTIQLPLSITYRCAKEITKLAQTIVPSIQYHENAIDGIVRNGKLNEIESNDLILCRVNKSLISLCIKFLSENKKAYVKGKDIGANLSNMLKRTKKTNMDKAMEHLHNDKTKLINKLKSKGLDAKDIDTNPQVISFTEKLDCLEVLSDGLATVKAVIDRIEKIFSDNSNGICLSSVHKAKGLEADRVFIIEPKQMPAKWAKQDWQKEQELNIYYVAITRAKKELIFIEESEFTTYEK